MLRRCGGVAGDGRGECGGRESADWRCREGYRMCEFPECGKEFSHEYKMRNHMKTVHGIVE